jgi:replicative DNA helicase
MLETVTALQQLYRLILHEHQQLYSLWQSADVLQSQYDQSLAPEVVEAHLQGSQIISVRLLQPGSNLAKAGCIDFDAPKDGCNEQALRDVLFLAQRVHQVATSLGLPAYLEFSGRRGFHLWLFVDLPLPGATWVKALQNLCYLANYQPKEIYPSTATTAIDGKASGRPIKLPCGKHQISGKWSGFLSEVVTWLNGFPVVPENQTALMTAFRQIPAAQLAQLAVAEINPSREARSNGHQRQGGQSSLGTLASANAHRSAPTKLTDFSSLGKDEHPACIHYLMHQGAPTDQDYNSVNLTLARYVTARGWERNQAEAVVEAMARASEHHPTSKITVETKLRNFDSAYASVRRNPQDYQWSCSYIRNSRELVRCGGCTGYACAFWPWEKPVGDNEVAKRVERDVLVYVLHHPEAGMQEALGVDLPSEGFIATFTPKGNDSPFGSPPFYLHQLLWKCFVNLEMEGKALTPSLVLSRLERLREENTPLTIPVLNQVAGYLDELLNIPPCGSETFTELLLRVRDTGLRLLAKEQAVTASEWLDSPLHPVAETLETLIHHSQHLQQRNASEILPMVAYTQDLIRELFGQPQTAIATPAPWLNRSLNGGLHPGRLYVVGAPPGSGKTTWCAWCADEAAKAKIPVLYVSFEMGKQQLWVNALSRMGGLNSGLIEAKHWMNADYPHAEWLKQQSALAIRAYDQQVAEYLTVLEAGPEATVAHLKGTIAQIRRNADLSATAPVLVIVDYLQLMCCGDEKLDSGANEVLRVSRVATGLKQLARDTGAAVVAISDINKAAYQEALRTGTLDMGALRDSFKIAHAADCIMLLQTGKAQRGNEQPRDQLDLLEERYAGDYLRLRQIQDVRDRYPLNDKAKATYARLSILKNRGGMTAEPLFVYERAYHRFVPIDLDLGEDNAREDL